MSTPDRFRRSTRATVCCFAALALAACSNSGSIDGEGGSGGTAPGSGGATGGSAAGGSAGPGQGGTLGTGGTTGSGGDGTSGFGGTTGAAGKGGAMGSAGTSGGAGTGGKGSGGTTGAAGKGGSGGTAGATGGHGGGSGGGSGGSASSGTGGGPVPDGGVSAATATIPGNGCTPPAAYADLFISLLGETQAQSEAKVSAAWSQLFNPSNANTIFYTGPGTGEAYIEDVADNAVRSEGQSYGMMIALQLNHQTEFDELWTFVKNHMWKSGSNTISWQTSTAGAVTGSGGAPDGDEWFAAALVFAHNRWGDTSGKYNYGTEAQATLDLVRTTDISPTQYLVRYFTGSDSNGTDASYMLPAFYQTWACFDTANADFWNKVLTTTRAWLQTAAGTTGNIGDQSSFAGVTTNSSGDDKLRTIANFMSDYNFFDADPFEATYASEYATWVSSNNNGSTAMLACNGLLGFGLPAATGKPWVQKLWSVAIPTGTYRYYDGALYTIALLHVSGTFHLWY